MTPERSPARRVLAIGNKALADGVDLSKVSQGVLDSTTLAIQELAEEEKRETTGQRENQSTS